MAEQEQAVTRARFDEYVESLKETKRHFESIDQTLSRLNKVFCCEHAIKGENDQALACMRSMADQDIQSLSNSITALDRLLDTELTRRGREAIAHQQVEL